MAKIIVNDIVENFFKQFSFLFINNRNILKWITQSGNDQTSKPTIENNRMFKGHI